MVMTTLAGSVGLAFVLGLRHGLDADHLAAIDGLTRWNTGRKFAPYCGALFATGHASVIFAAALGLSVLASQWEPPAWLGPIGGLVSSLTLLLLSAINLRIGLGESSNGTRGALGLRSRAFATLLHAPKPWQVVLLGALFALSLDAIVLATLFAASSTGDAIRAGELALAFASGMVAVGAANGLWVMRLLKHSDEASRYASRVMTLTIAFVGLIIGAAVLLSLVSEPLERWVCDYEFAISGSVVTIVLAGYFGALMLANRIRKTLRHVPAEAPKPGAVSCAD